MECRFQRLRVDATCFNVELPDWLRIYSVDTSESEKDWYYKERKITMNEKDKAMQEENKAVQDGMMSDDELDNVAGGLVGIISSGSGDHIEEDCGCLDGMAPVSRGRYVCDCMDGEGGPTWRERLESGSIVLDTDTPSIQPW